MKQNSYRDSLISAALEFAERAWQVKGVRRIAIIGSLTTDKAKPKDADVLVTIGDATDIKKLADLGRRLKGRTQSLSSGADIFLIDREGKYLGRTCRWKVCRPAERISCEAMNCGRVPHLYDDLKVVKLSRYVTANPPAVIYPRVFLAPNLPADLVRHVEQRFGKTAGSD